MVITTSIIGEQRVLLYNVSWQLFQYMLTELGENRSTRLAYDDGTLEIMTPLLPHEHYKRLIEKMIDCLVEELNLNLKSIGSMTCKRNEIAKGLEPDSGFYIQNEQLVRHSKQIDLNQDPPPDLMLEMDFSNSSLNKMSIYLSLEVPELWQYIRGELHIYQLQAGKYIPLHYSPTFANLPLADEIPQFLEQSNQIGEVQMIRNFRNWVKEQV